MQRHFKKAQRTGHGTLLPTGCAKSFAREAAHITKPQINNPE
jgi:hypothetical protein